MGEGEIDGMIASMHEEPIGRDSISTNRNQKTVLEIEGPEHNRLSKEEENFIMQPGINESNQALLQGEVSDAR